METDRWDMKNNRIIQGTSACHTGNPQTKKEKQYLCFSSQSRSTPVQSKV